MRPPCASADMPPSGADAEGSSGAPYPDKGGPGPLTLGRLQSNNQSALASASLGQLSQKHIAAAADASNTLGVTVASDPGAAPSGHVTVCEGSALGRMPSAVGSVSEPLALGRVQEGYAPVPLPQEPGAARGAEATASEDARRRQRALEHLQSSIRSGRASLSDPLPLPLPSSHSQRDARAPAAQAEAPGVPTRHTEQGSAQGVAQQQASWQEPPLDQDVQAMRKELAAALEQTARGLREGGESLTPQPVAPAGMQGGAGGGRQQAAEDGAAAEGAAGAGGAELQGVRDLGNVGDVGLLEGSRNADGTISGGLLTNPALRQYVANWLASWTGHQAQQALTGVDLADPLLQTSPTGGATPVNHPERGHAFPEALGAREGMQMGAMGGGAEQQRGPPTPLPPRQLHQTFQPQARLVNEAHARQLPPAVVEDAESCANYSWTSSLSAFLDQELLRDDAEDAQAGGGGGSGAEGPGARWGVPGGDQQGVAPGARAPVHEARGAGEGRGGGGAQVPHSAAATAPMMPGRVAPGNSLLAHSLDPRLSLRQQEPLQPQQNQHHQPQQIQYQQPQQNQYHQQQQYLPPEAAERRLLPRPHDAMPMVYHGSGAPLAYQAPATPAAPHLEPGPPVVYRGMGGPLLGEAGALPAYRGTGAPAAHPEGGAPVVHGMRQRRAVEVLEAGEEGEVESAPRRRKRVPREGPGGPGVPGPSTADRDRVMGNSLAHADGAIGSKDDVVAVQRQYFYASPQRPCGVPQFADAAEIVYERINPTGDRALRRRRLESSAFPRDSYGAMPVCPGAGASPAQGLDPRDPFAGLERFAAGGAGAAPAGADARVGRVGGAWGEDAGPAAGAEAWGAQAARGRGRAPGASLAVEQRRWDFRTMLEQCNASESDALLLRKTMELGEALASSDLEAFRAGFPILSQFANPHGAAMSRVLHFMLHGFLLRLTGMGYAAFNCPSAKPSQEMDNARDWYFKHSPTVSQFQTVALCTLCSVLAGKRRVHMVEFGFFMYSKWPTIFKILSQVRQQPEYGAASHGHAPGALLPHEQAIHDRHIGLLALSRRHAAAYPGAGAANLDAAAGAANPGTGPWGAPSRPHAKARMEAPTEAVHLRLTLVDLHGLTSPKRSDPQQQRQAQQQQLATWLRVAAATAGIELELELLDVDKENLPQLPAKVVRRPWEALVVAAALEFDNLLDSRVLPIGQRETILQWVGGLKPLVFVMVGIDLDINNLPFLDRLYNVLVHCLPLFLSNEVLAHHKNGTQHLHVFEDLFISRGTTNTIACEGEERVMRSQAMHRWKACMDAVGLVPGPMHGVDVAQTLLKGYPEGYGLQVGHGSIRLSFRGSSEMALSSWVPK